MADPRKAVVKKAAESHVAQHAMKKAAPTARATQSSSGKHRVPRSAQAKSDAKELITFPASKTKNAMKLSFDNKMAPAQKPQKSVVTYRHVIAAEFWVGLILILLSKTPANKNKSGTLTVPIQLAAWALVFAILFGITASGRETARFAAALGGLIVTTVLMKQRFFTDNSAKPSKTEDNGAFLGPGAPTQGVGRMREI